MGRASNIANIPNMSWFFKFCSLYLSAEIIITIGTDNLKNRATIDTGKILIDA